MGKRPGRSSRLAYLGHQLGYRVRLALLTVFGPPQLGNDKDPLVRLRREQAEWLARRRDEQPD